MTATIPTKEPTSFIAGDAVSWDRAESSDYPISEGYTLTYAIRGRDELNLGPSEITSIASTGTYEVRIPSTSTAKLTAGRYVWAAFATSAAGERHTIEQGAFQVEEDLATAVGGETHNEKVYRILSDVIEGRVEHDTESFSLHGRAVNKTPMETLMKLRGIYAHKVAQERNPGQSTIRSHLVTFVGA